MNLPAYLLYAGSVCRTHGGVNSHEELRRAAGKKLHAIMERYER